MHGQVASSHSKDAAGDHRKTCLCASTNEELHSNPRRDGAAPGYVRLEAGLYSLLFEGFFLVQWSLLLNHRSYLMVLTSRRVRCWSWSRIGSYGVRVAHDPWCSPQTCHGFAWPFTAALPGARPSVAIRSLVLTLSALNLLNVFQAHGDAFQHSDQLCSLLPPTGEAGRRGEALPPEPAAPAHRVGGLGAAMAATVVGAARRAALGAGLRGARRCQTLWGLRRGCAGLAVDDTVNGLSAEQRQVAAGGGSAAAGCGGGGRDRGGRGGAWRCAGVCRALIG